MFINHCSTANNGYICNAMNYFDFDINKSINAVLYILNKVGTLDYHKTFKILYFAEQKHLKHYGRPITGDSYVAMKYGPVPSYIYDIFKAIDTKNHPFVDYREYEQYFAINAKSVTPKVAANTEELSESDILFLDESIEENKNLAFLEITDKSHDTAWEEAYNNAECQDMDFITITTASGADDKMIQYIKSANVKLV